MGGVYPSIESQITTTIVAPLRSQRTLPQLSGGSINLKWGRNLKHSERVGNWGPVNINQQGARTITYTEALQELEIAPTASLDEIRSAYRLLVRVWHPDKHHGDEAVHSRATAKLQRINEAWEVLKSCTVPESNPTSDDQQVSQEDDEPYAAQEEYEVYTPSPIHVKAPKKFYLYIVDFNSEDLDRLAHYIYHAIADGASPESLISESVDDGWEEDFSTWLVYITQTKACPIHIVADEEPESTAESESDVDPESTKNRRTRANDPQFPRHRVVDVKEGFEAYFAKLKENDVNQWLDDVFVALRNGRDPGEIVEESVKVGWKKPFAFWLVYLTQAQQRPIRIRSIYQTQTHSGSTTQDLWSMILELPWWLRWFLWLFILAACKAVYREMTK